MSENTYESGRLDRRQLLGGAAAASAVALSATNLLLPGHAATATPGNGIRPFHYRAKEEELVDLRRRVAATRWPERETVGDTTQGVQLATMQKVAQYWADGYDWRKIEARMNALPQFITEIDGIDIHFIHVKSKHANALPVIITHGWPGSIIEQLKVIEPLTNPTAHGGTAADAFNVVIPSLPGHGFSGKATAPGWTVLRVARAWAVLMQRLGYTRYVAQGGDHGNAVSEIMALQKPVGLVGIHTNMAATVPPDISRRLTAHEPAPAGLGPEEQRAWDQLDDFFRNGVGYAIEMNTRPQSLYALEDSPVGHAAWMIDHDIRSHHLIARVFDGHSEGLTKDDVLDNITLYWLTNTAVSAARFFWDNAQVAKGGFFDARGVDFPVAVSAFPDEIYQAPRSWAQQAYPQLIYYNRPAKGGHFAAWEQPASFSAELRTAFRSLRQPA